MIEYELIYRILISVALGALIGLERQVTHRPAGLRTHMLVSLGACLFTIIASTSYSSYPSPILAGILTGIGFIGAGSIIAAGGEIKGVTTAASLWAVASVGFAVGSGNYVLGVVAASIVFLILQLRKVEGRIERRKKP